VEKKTLQTIDTRVKALKARENGAFEEIEYFTNYSHRSTIKKDNPDSFFFQKADTTAKATKAPKKSKENKEPKKVKEPKPKKEKKAKLTKKMKKQSVESSGSSEEFNISDIIEDDDNIEPKIESESDMDEEYKTITSISKKRKRTSMPKKEEPSKKK